MSIFYKSIRVGKNLKPFTLYKFRTMVEGADKIGEPTSEKNDPRITRIGSFLRKTKLDELPQLINVLRGDMALVGPRPEVPEVVKLMSGEEKDIIFSVKPGITGIDSLWNYNEAALIEKYQNKEGNFYLSPHTIYMREIWPYKKFLQMEYVERKSILFDLRILCLTILILPVKLVGKFLR